MNISSKYKNYLESLIDDMRRALGMRVDDRGEPATGDAAGDVDATKDGQEDFDE